MDVSTFYALFSATCFTLVGLWWGVVQRDLGWVGDPPRRRAVAGVYLAFLLPALMGLFAQVGGDEDPAIWRVSFVAIAAVGAVATVRLLSQDSDRTVGGVRAVRAGAVVVYAVVAIVGVFPGVAGPLGLRAIQAEALLLVLLVAIGHALAWWFLTEQVDHPA